LFFDLQDRREAWYRRRVVVPACATLAGTRTLWTRGRGVRDHLRVVVEFCGVRSIVGFRFRACSAIATGRSWRGCGGGGSGWGIWNTLRSLAISVVLRSRWRWRWVRKRRVVEIVSLLAVHVEVVVLLLLLWWWRWIVGELDKVPVLVVGVVVKGRHGLRPNS
jgi:hypothetical protein